MREKLRVHILFDEKDQRLACVRLSRVRSFRRFHFEFGRWVAATGESYRSGRLFLCLGWQ
jgi:hypothetical protein